MSAPGRRSRRAPARRRRRRRPPAPCASGTAAIGDVGNTLAAAPGIGRRGAARAFSSTSCSARARRRTGDALADAAREHDEHTPPTPGPRRSAGSRAPHAPYSAGPELLRRIFAAAAARRARHVDPRRRGRGRAGPAARRRGPLAGGARPRWASIRATRVPAAIARSPTWPRWARSTGATPPLLVHMVHAGAEDRRLARDAGATVVLCPRSNLHIGGRLPDVAGPARRRAAARARHRQPRLDARPVAVGRAGDAGRRISRRARRRAGWTPPPAAARAPWA